MGTSQENPEIQLSISIQKTGPPLINRGVNLLNSFCKNWRNYDDAKNYSIQAHLNRELAIETDSIDDDLMQNAIKQSNDDDHLAPFIAINNYDIDNAVQSFRNSFPHISTVDLENTLNRLSQDSKNEQHRNILLVGPKIGIVAVEVIDCKFSDQDFTSSNSEVPPAYKNGLDRLELIDAFMELVQKASSFELPTGDRLRKILFTPNLEKNKFAKWRSEMTNNNAQKKNKKPQTTDWDEIDKQISRLIPIFGDNVKNIYEILKCIFQYPFPLPFQDNESYENCIALIAGSILHDQPKVTMETNDWSYMRKNQKIQQPQSQEARFLGPARHSFDSFEEQCDDYLNTYCPNWRDDENPKSYIIPPMFTYKWQLVSDEDFDKYRHRNLPTARKNSRDDKVINDRLSDEAEHIGYSSIYQAIEKNVQAPFLAIHGFTLDKKRLELLKSIFPNAAWTQFHRQIKSIFNDDKRGDTCEYDFLIIGAKIGVVVIEVKSSPFQGPNGFIDGQQHLPSDYKKGLNQLKSIEALLNILEQCTKVKRPDSSCLSKIILAPNLTRKRYDEWSSFLEPDQKIKIDKKYVAHTIQLFEEDVSKSDHDSNRSIYDRLKTLLENLGKDSKFRPQSGYDYYGKIFAGISAMTQSGTLSIDTLSFSAGLVAQKIFRLLDQKTNQLSEAERVDLNHGYHPGASQLRKSNQLQTLSNHSKKSIKPPVMFLTPEQLQTIQGNSRQIIAGAAGTGKTMLLQQKALELLDKGEKVVVIAPKMFGIKYQLFFEENLCARENYQISNWSEFSDFHIPSENRHQAEQVWSEIMQDYKSLLQCNNIEIIRKRLSETPNEALAVVWKNAGGDSNDLSSKCSSEQRSFLSSELEEGILAMDTRKSRALPLANSLTQSCVYRTAQNRIMGNFDFCKRILTTLFDRHILVDDAIAEMCSSDASCLILLAILVLAIRSNFERTVWIAYDPVQFDVESDRIPKKIWLLWSVLSNCIGFSQTKLTRVMRCSAEIFSCAIKRVKAIMEKAKKVDSPVIGHKIQGVTPISDWHFFFTADDAWTAMEKELPRVVASLLNRDALRTASNNFVGIVLSGKFETEHILDIIRKIQDECPRHTVTTLSSYQKDQQASVVVSRSCEVFSYEWPLVIYVSWGTIDAPFFGLLRSYYAYSRAIAGLIQLLYFYDPDDKPVSKFMINEAPATYRVMTPSDPIVCLTAEEAWEEILQQLRNLIEDGLSKASEIGIILDGSYAQEKQDEIAKRLSSHFRIANLSEKGRTDVSIFVGDFHGILAFEWPYLIYVICESENDKSCEKRGKCFLRLNLARARVPSLSVLNFKFKIEIGQTSQDDKGNSNGVTEWSPSKCRYPTNPSIFQHFQSVRIPDDKNCLYRSISEFISSPFVDHAKIKAQVEHFLASMAADGKEIKNAGSSGDDDEIVALATLFQRPVYVFQSSTDEKFDPYYYKYCPLFLTEALWMVKGQTELPVVVARFSTTYGYRFEPMILKKQQSTQLTKKKYSLDQTPNKETRKNQRLNTL